LSVFQVLQELPVKDSAYWKKGELSFDQLYYDIPHSIYNCN
jgi:hypothetical protein